MMTKKIIPTILCGGVGSRLWPVSREEHPKPFIKLADGESLIQKAFKHAMDLKEVEEILTITNQSLLFKIKDEYSSVNTKGLSSSYILEPVGRNTAAALASAAVVLQEQHGPDAICLVLAADHLIEDQEAFQSAVSEAVVLSEDEFLVTFGITPNAPETGFGYIEADGNNVKRFVEKPNVETAEEFLKAGNYYWNSGMFCFKVGVLLAEMEKHRPALLASVRDCVNHSEKLSDKNLYQLHLDKASFEAVEDISIDYAVMEKSSNVAVVPCEIGWSDIGSWDAMSELVGSDDNNNAIEGEVVLHNTHNCYIKSGHNRIIGTSNVDNLIIIDTDDALLVADKDSAQDVKVLFNHLKAQDHPAYKLHQTVHRPWGTYTILENGPDFKIKRIVVKPGASLSLQMHHHRSEHWIVVSGAAIVVNGDEELFIATNESTYIPAGHKHRLTNPGKIDLVLIEVQSGEYLEEDDIVRFEDVYGRS